MQLRWADAGNVINGCCGATVNRCKFEFFRKVGAAWTKTYSTPWVNDNVTPQSNLLKVPLVVLCNADMNAEIKISVVTESGEVNRVTLTIAELE
jgi:hypothetical protein